MEQLLISFLHKNNVFSFSANDLKLQLLSHSAYPSFRAITDTLDYFSIENIAANVPKDALPQLPKTFLALIETEGIPELVLVNQRNSSIVCIDMHKKKRKMTAEEFQKTWNGTLVAIEAKEKEPSYKKFKISMPQIAAIIAAAALVCIVILGKFSMVEVAYMGIGFIGVIISYLIGKEELGIKDSVTTKVCGAISGGDKGCSNVINSREGKIFGSLGLGDLSLLFFMTTVLLAIFIQPTSSLLFILSIATIPVICYTLGIQVFKLKQYCLLCLGISLLLVSQFVLLFTAFTSWDFSLIEALQFMAIAGLCTSGWLIAKGLWKRNITLSQTEQDYYRFKRTPLFFKEALGRTKTYNINTISNEHRITFGNALAPIKIQAITNPFCGYCKKPFETYIRLLERHPQDIQVEFIFNVAPDASNEATQLTLKVIEMYRNDPSVALKALVDWFENKDLKVWNSKYPKAPTMLLQPTKIIEAHYEWCKTNEIHHTPETLINGRVFPKNHYEFSDIPLFIETLKEAISESAEKSHI